MSFNPRPRATRSVGGSLNILAVGPLPYVHDGVRSFDFGLTVFNGEMFLALAQRGHRVRVISQTPVADENGRRNSFGSGIPNFAVEPFALEFRTARKPPSPADLAKTRAQLEPIFERMVAQERPDVIIAGAESMSWHLAGLGERHRLPSLLIAHGSPTASLREGIYPEETTSALIAHIRRMTSIVCVAQHLADVLNSFGIDNVRTIPNAADTERFRPQRKSPSLLAQHQIEPQQPVVAHVSTFHNSKGLADIVASAEFVLKSNPRVVYLIIGGGPERGAMEQLCRDKGIEGSFRFAGTLEHHRMPEYLNLADIVVHPSLREGCPFIYRETQACGRVLLASDIAAAREAIVDGETGRLFRTGNVSDLADKTIALIGDPAARARIGVRARSAAEQWSREHWVDEYVEALRECALALA